LFTKRPLHVDDKAAKLLTPDARSRLAAVHQSLVKLNDWTAAGIEAAVRSTAQDLGIKLGDLAQPLRAASTGRTVSPGIFDVLAVLGREEALARIEDQAAS
jgi:glutamyl-tRNA synthetase